MCSLQQDATVLPKALINPLHLPLQQADWQTIKITDTKSFEFQC